MVSSYLEAYTKASKTSPGAGPSISSASTSTPLSTLGSMLEDSLAERQSQCPPQSLDYGNEGDTLILPSQHKHPSQAQLAEEFTPNLWESSSGTENMEDCASRRTLSEEHFSQFEETSTGEFAFMQVMPDDCTVLHDVTVVEGTRNYFLDQAWSPREQGKSQDLHQQPQYPLRPERKATHAPAPLQHAASFNDALGRDKLPVRNTFIHIIESPDAPTEAAEKQWSSCPGMVMTKEFHTKYPAMEQAHIHGDCRPCAYFVNKGDGCRWGGNCKFCHLCPPGALKKKKREKVKALKERDYFLKLASMQGDDSDAAT